MWERWSIAPDTSQLSGLVVIIDFHYEKRSVMSASEYAVSDLRGSSLCHVNSLPQASLGR
jgi:hypothetical protein